MNPLLQIHTPIPFDLIQAPHIEPAIDELIARSQAKLDVLATSSGPRTYLNTLGALDKATEELDHAMTLVRHIEFVATSPEVRAAHNAVEPKASAFYSRIPLNEGLWRMLREFSETAEAKALTGTAKRHLDRKIEEFRKHGAELDHEGKQKLAAIDVELSQLTTKYQQNVLDATNAFELVITDPAQLAGLPESAISAARASASSKNIEGWRFTLQAPSYIAVMTYLDDASIREKVYRAYQTRGASETLNNRPLVDRILELRSAKANLLGVTDFADFVLSDRMAKTGARAMEFLELVQSRTEAVYRQENAALKEFRRKLEGPNAADLQPWDLGYYSEKLRKGLYDFDEEELRPYFSLDRVVAGMYETVTRLYGVTIVEKAGVPVWHPDVKYFEIVEDGRTLGGFYADWYPRETKRGGAWMDAFIIGEPAAIGRNHIGAINGNLTPPVEGKPALLTHREVETIFHEFGHLLHHCLSRVEVTYLSGTAVAWDFVELPSQIMENWCWEKESLDLFARHYETGAPIPDELIAKMNRARNFRIANAQMRQISFGTVDLKLHREYNAARDGDPVAYSRAILQQYSSSTLPEEHAMILAFTHLFASPVGYGAGYYSYKWAEVLDADAFGMFREKGVFDRETGMRFRRYILERGDSEDPGELYRLFRGRDPELNALLQRQGLA